MFIVTVQYIKSTVKEFNQNGAISKYYVHNFLDEDGEVLIVKDKNCLIDPQKIERFSYFELSLSPFPYVTSSGGAAISWSLKLFRPLK